jgi:glyoxylase-like metal-dependent hydrolase (beta-lactamase superfamily II)
LEPGSVFKRLKNWGFGVVSLNQSGAQRGLSASAKEWFELIRFADDVTLIHEPWMPFFYRCNMWHMRGRERDILLDTGSGALHLTSLMPWLTARPTICILSHTHWDHIGSAHEFSERWVHVAEATILANPTNDATLAAAYAVDDAEVMARMFDKSPPGWRGSAYRLQPAPPTGVLADSDRIELGGRTLMVVHTPGHSPGHISLFEEQTGILFAGDALYDGPLVDTCYHSDIDVYCSTMRRLRDIDPHIVHAGHFPSFGPTRYRQIIDNYLSKRADRSNSTA